MQPFTIEDHTGDTRIQAHGYTQRDLFVHAARSLWHIMEPQYATQTISNPIPIDVYAPRISYLLVDVLSEIVSYSDAYQIAYERITISELSNTRCVGTISGYPTTQYTGLHIKGITYHQASVTYDSGVWSAHLIYDT